MGCVFCDRIRDGEYDRTSREAVVSFVPLNPVTPGHRLFLPVRHVGNSAADPDLTGEVFRAAAIWARDRNGPHNLITSAGADATQTVWHLHVHYVPRSTGDGLPLPWTGQARPDRSISSRTAPSASGSVGRLSCVRPRVTPCVT